MGVARFCNDLIAAGRFQHPAQPGAEHRMIVDQQHAPCKHGPPSPRCRLRPGLSPREAPSTPRRQTRPSGLLPAPNGSSPAGLSARSEEHTSELQSHSDLVCRLLLEKKKKK